MARRKAKPGTKRASAATSAAAASAAAALDAVKSLLKDAIEMLDANNIDAAASAIELSIEHIDAQLNDDDTIIEIEDDVVLPGGGVLTGLAMLYGGGKSGVGADPATPTDVVDAALLTAIGSRDAKAAAKISGLPQGDLARTHDANMNALLAALLARRDH